MIKFINFILIVLLILITVSCSQDDTISDNPPAFTVKILPIGDSRVQGDNPNHESYRYELWRNFIRNNWTIDFLGTAIDNSEYPQFLDLDFDRDHAGVGGSTTKKLLATIKSTLDSIETPDVVLLGIGGNDLIIDNSYEDAILNIKRIIEIIQEHNPDISIFIEQIAPAKSTITSPEDAILLQNFNNAILSTAIESNTESSEVIAIDMSENWNDFFLVDDIHYTLLGAKIVADRYFDAIDQYIE